MKKICVIGRVARDKKLYDGQTVLTRTLSEELCVQMPDYKFYYVDTYKYKQHVFKCFILTIFYCLICDDVVILLSRNGLSFYLPFLYYLNKLFKKNIYHRVIGGNLDRIVSQHPVWVKYLNALKFNYVELSSLSSKLKKIGVSNVKVSPNFKHVGVLDKEDVKIYSGDDEIRFCTFCRVIREKGIEEAIDVIVKYNNTHDLKIFLDIYGPIDDKYAAEFNSKVKKSRNVFYKGIVSPENSVNILREYYMLLFPTYWEGEGFPGTLIDAFSSGVPTIATNWNYNGEIIKNNVTGMIYDYKNKSLLYDKIDYAIQHVDEINNMRFKCIAEAKKYDASIVVRQLVNDIRFNEKHK